MTTKRNGSIDFEKEFRRASILVLHFFQLMKLVLTTNSKQGSAATQLLQSGEERRDKYVSCWGRSLVV
jgi:hypothetical protein